MKKMLMVIGLVLLIASFALAGAPKPYQVTGPVLEFDGDHITVQKGNEKWEIAFDKDVKVTGGKVEKGSQGDRPLHHESLGGGDQRGRQSSQTRQGSSQEEISQNARGRRIGGFEILWGHQYRHQRTAGGPSGNRGGESAGDHRRAAVPKTGRRHEGQGD